jgi:hypothetical protein
MKRRKLTNDMERNIRRAYFKEGIKGQELVERFGVSVTTLTRVLGEAPSGKGFKVERVYS